MGVSPATNPLNVRIGNTAPNVGISKTTPNIRVSIGTRTQTSPATTKTFGGKGYLIGMLGLTYTQAYTVTIPATYQGILAGPNVRISNR